MDSVSFKESLAAVGSDLDLLRFSYPLKLDFCRMTLRELTAMINLVIEENKASPDVYKPIVAIGHTKDLTDFSTVEALLRYLRSKEIATTDFRHTLERLSPVAGHSSAAFAARC